MLRYMKNQMPTNLCPLRFSCREKKKKRKKKKGFNGFAFGLWTWAIGMVIGF